MIKADHISRFRVAVREIGQLADSDVDDEGIARQLHSCLIELVRLYLLGIAPPRARNRDATHL